MTWIIKNVNRIAMHCGVAYESVCSFAISHVIRVWFKAWKVQSEWTTLVGLYVVCVMHHNTVHVTI